MLILSVLLNLSPVTSWAETLNTKISGSKKVIQIDDNKDKKIDLIETYENNLLVKKEQDLNFDGVMDVTTEYFYNVVKDAPSAIETKKDRQSKIYRNEKLNLIIKTTEIDTDGDGKYDRTITEKFPLIQKDELCAPEIKTASEEAVALNKQISQVTNKLKDNEFVENKLGYKIHQSCIDNYGAADFSKILTNSMTKGLSCLEGLALKNTKQNPKAPNGALNNYEGLRRLLKNDKVTIVCNEKNYNWSGTAAHASTKADEVLEELGIKHPFISVSAEDPKVSGKPTGKEIAFLTDTLFHEQLHNLGIVHGEGVEYPYSCAECCIGPEKYPGTKAAACKVCSGQYDTSKGVAKNYLTDLLSWGEKSFDSSKAERALKSYQLEHPHDLWSASLQARANSNAFSAVGIEMARILEKRSPLTAEDKKNLKIALSSRSKELDSVSNQAKVIAAAHLNYYHDADLELTMKTLEANKEMLLKIVRDGNGNTGSSDLDYINQKLFEDTKSILMDVFLFNYPNSGPTSTRAFDLLEELKLL